MPHYFLNAINGSGLTCDPEGENFPDLQAARAKAVESVRSILSDELRSTGSLNLRGRIEIVDADGTVVLTLRFREAIELLDEASQSPEGA